jgi:hypothetical protein
MRKMAHKSGVERSHWQPFPQIAAASWHEHIPPQRSASNLCNKRVLRSGFPVLLANLPHKLLQWWCAAVLPQKS